MNVDKICEEILWYSKKDENTDKWIIPVVVDFDYTLTKESSWLEGTFTKNNNCFDIMKKWEDEFGVKFMLETMRGEDNIQPAIDFCRENGIEFFGIGRNPLQDADGDTTCKCWGIWSIDDRNAGIFLHCPDDGRPYVNWEILDDYLTPILRKVYNRLPELEEQVLSNRKKIIGR